MPKTKTIKTVEQLTTELCNADHRHPAADAITVQALDAHYRKESK